MAYDVVIKNGTVVDGTVRPPARADVAIVGDRIAEVGRSPRCRQAYARC
jgi:N-acyl-D-amino-acid deacylase